MFSNDKERERYLINTGTVMAAQDNLATQYPLWVIQQDVRVWVEEGMDYDERERLEDVKEYWLCDRCQKKHDAGEELPADCLECDEPAYDHYKLEPQFVISHAGVFFTQQGCQNHIDANSYHYRNPRPYAVAAWRNPEMVAVMQHLIINSGEQLPSHYK